MNGTPHDPPTALAGASPLWRRNLAVCVFGAFTTTFAMTLVLPFLSVFVEHLGVSGRAAIVQWSGIAFSATFITAGLTAPLWGRLGDRYGRKPMLVRASLGMATVMALMGFVTQLWQLVALRLLIGIAGGYASGAQILIASQAPKERSSWALALLMTGVMAGNLLGPLVGGVLPPLIGIKATFWCASALIFVAFLATAWWVREVPVAAGVRRAESVSWSKMPGKPIVVTMLVTGLLLMMANMSIEPIITVYVASLVNDPLRVTLLAGVVISATALGSILSATYLGRTADRIGHARVITCGLAVAAALLIPQAFVTAAWQLIALRFLMGIALGGLLPSIGAMIRHHVPEQALGLALGLSIAAQFAGQVIGPLLGGFVGGHVSMQAVFITTSALMAVGAVGCHFFAGHRHASPSPHVPS